MTSVLAVTLSLNQITPTPHRSIYSPLGSSTQHRNKMGSDMGYGYRSPFKDSKITTDYNYPVPRKR